MMVQDLTGKIFGRLTVLYRVENKIYPGVQRSQWLCECSCENKSQIKLTSDCLKRGNTKSCGCLLKEKAKDRMIAYNTTHGLSYTRIYQTYKNILRRCYNPKCKAFHWYGERGIIIDEKWRNDFTLFYNWTLNSGYEDDLTIERIDVNGNYTETNCCWITQKKQNINRRNSINITINDTTKNLTEWAKIFNINTQTLRRRYYLDATIKELFTPINKNMSRKRKE